MPMVSERKSGAKYLVLLITDLKEDGTFGQPFFHPAHFYNMIVLRIIELCHFIKPVLLRTP